MPEFFVYLRKGWIHILRPSMLMGKTVYYRYTVTSLGGSKLMANSQAYMLERCIGYAEKELGLQNEISYDKVWRGISYDGAYAQVVTLGQIPGYAAGSVGVLTFSYAEGYEQPLKKRPVRTGAKKADLKIDNPTALLVPAPGPPDTLTWVHEGPAAEHVAQLQAADDAPLNYSFRVYYSKLNAITKRPNKTEYHEEVSASTEEEARRAFWNSPTGASKTGVEIRRVEVAGSL